MKGCRARSSSIAAARQALTTFAPAEARRHLERALEIWPRVPDAEQRTGVDAAEVASLAGQAAYTAGDLDRSVSLFDQALALLPADQVTRAHAVVLSSLAACLWRTNDLTTTMSMAARAVRVAREVGAAQQEADASITLGMVRIYCDASIEGVDDAVFADAGRFDIRRHPNPHLVFGHGPHFCLGAHLARTQMRALFDEVLARTSSLRYAGPPSYLRSNFQRGVKRLPVGWTA